MRRHRYYCMKCKRNHFTDSMIGRSHSRHLTFLSPPKTKEYTFYKYIRSDGKRGVNAVVIKTDDDLDSLPASVTDIFTVDAIYRLDAIKKGKRLLREKRRKK